MGGERGALGNGTDGERKEGEGAGRGHPRFLLTLPLI